LAAAADHPIIRSSDRQISHGFPRLFHFAFVARLHEKHLRERLTSAVIRARRTFRGSGINSAAPFFWHGPVDEMHSIENKPDISRYNPIDLNPRRSTSASFFDRF
jgi:hypothetical protein